MSKKGIDLLAAFVIVAFLLNGCSFVNVLRKIDVDQKELDFAYKYRKESEKAISVGMPKEELINNWGEPLHSYKLEENRLKYDADEMLVYSQSEQPFPANGEISYKIYIKDNKVIKIIESLWKEGFVEFEDLF